MPDGKAPAISLGQSPETHQTELMMDSPYCNVLIPKCLIVISLLRPSFFTLNLPMRSTCGKRSSTVKGPYLEKAQMYAPGESLDELPLHEKTRATIRERLSLYRRQTHSRYCWRIKTPSLLPARAVGRPCAIKFPSLTTCSVIPHRGCVPLSFIR